MKTRSVLVAFPGYPFSIQTLLPNPGLAGVAGGLDALGHSTEIWDYGSVELVDRVFPTEIRAATRIVANGDCAPGSLTALSALWRLRRMSEAFAARQVQVGAEVAVQLASIEDLNFVAFWLDQETDFRASLVIAERLRAWAPHVRQVAMGPFVERRSGDIARATEVFDCCCVRDPEWSISRWADRFDRSETWPRLPNLAFRGMAAAARFEGETWPAPCYQPEIYPALATGMKLLLFAVETARGTQSKPVRSVCNEMAGLLTCHRVRAFQCVGSEPTAAQVDALAHEILLRGLRLWYGRTGAIREMRLKSFAALKASGCQVMPFRVESGSQLLLDDYYHRDFGISEAERVLRACKLSDVFTLARVVYPCSEDDRHTRAETLRFVERTRPHGVEIEASGAGFGAGFGRTGPTARASRERESLVRDIGELGVATTLSAAAALAARVCGYEGHEQDFGALLRRQFFTGDIAGLASTVKRFNERVRTVANTVAFQPFEPTLAAVGN